MYLNFLSNQRWVCICSNSLSNQLAAKTSQSSSCFCQLSFVVIYGLYSRHDTERKEKSLSLSPFPLSWVVFPLVRSPIPFSRSDKWGMGGLEEGDAVTFHEEIFPGHFWWRGSPAICTTLCRSSTCTRARQLWMMLSLVQQTLTKYIGVTSIQRTS